MGSGPAEAAGLADCAIEVARPRESPGRVVVGDRPPAGTVRACKPEVQKGAWVSATTPALTVAPPSTTAAFPADSCRVAGVVHVENRHAASLLHQQQRPNSRPPLDVRRTVGRPGVHRAYWRRCRRTVRPTDRPNPEISCHDPGTDFSLVQQSFALVELVPDDAAAQFTAGVSSSLRVSAPLFTNDMTAQAASS